MSLRCRSALDVILLRCGQQRALPPQQPSDTFAEAHLLLHFPPQPLSHPPMQSLNAASAAGGGKGAGIPRSAAWLGATGFIPFFYYAAQHEAVHDASSKGPVPRFDSKLERLERLLPFPAAGAFDWLKSGDQLTVRKRFLTYGASILSFLGGIQWGLAMAKPAGTPGVAAQFAVSVVPSLVAWGALQAEPSSSIPYSLLSLSFLGVYAYDEKLVSSGRAPVWFTSLRTPLSIAVISSCAYSAYAIRPGQGAAGAASASGSEEKVKN